MSESVGFIHVAVTNALDPMGAGHVLQVGSRLYASSEDALEANHQPHVSHGWGYKAAELIVDP